MKQIFWKTRTLFKNQEYRFLVESTKIEIATFPHQTALSEANKERSFASNYFIFFKYCVSV